MSKAASGSADERFSLVRAASALRPHGARARYVAGCRCLPCRASNSRYESVRARLRAVGDWNGVVSAAPAREHMRNLSAAGVGRRSVADASGISDTILFGIATGDRERCRARTLRKILDVDLGAAKDGAYIAAGPTWQIIRALLKRGYSRVQLAEWIGQRRSLQIGKKRVRVATAGKVVRMALLLDRGKLVRSR